MCETNSFLLCFPSCRVGTFTVCSGSAVKEYPGSKRVSKFLRDHILLRVKLEDFNSVQIEFKRRWEQAVIILVRSKSEISKI
jgi:hypothetical protein